MEISEKRSNLNNWLEINTRKMERDANVYLDIGSIRVIIILIQYDQLFI